MGRTWLCSTKPWSTTKMDAERYLGEWQLHVMSYCFFHYYWSSLKRLVMHYTLSVRPSVCLSCACAIYWSCWQHCTDVPFNWRLPTAATDIFHTLLRTNKHKMNLWLAALHKKLCIDLREFFTKGNFKLISLWKWSRLIHCHLEVTVAQQVGHFGLKWL